MIHHPHDANGSPVEAATPADLTTDARRNADLEAFIDDVVTLADTAKEADFLRRAMHNVYNMGRTHEAIDSVNRMMETTRAIVEGVQS